MKRVVRTGYWGVGVLLLIALPAYAMLTPRWIARTVLVPSGEPSASISPSLLSLAASAGAGGLLGGAGTSLDFVRALFLDEQVLQQVVHRSIDDRAQVTVAHALGRGRPANGEETIAAARALRDKLSVSLDVSAQSLTVAVKSVDSASAVPALRGLVLVVDSMHRAAQLRQAAELRAFMEQQVADARSRLSRTEDRLERFLLDNRSMSTPSLQMQAARLERLVDLDRQWTQSLELQLAQAVFSEAKTIPVLSMAVPPSPPLAPDPRRVRMAVTVALMFVGMQIAFALLILPRAAQEFDWWVLRWVEESLRFRRVA